MDGLGFSHFLEQLAIFSKNDSFWEFLTSLIGYLSSIKMTFCGFLQIVLDRNFPKNLKTKPTIQKNVNGTFRRDIILIGSRLRSVSFGYPVSYQCHIFRKLSFNQKVFKIVHFSSKFGRFRVKNRRFLKRKRQWTDKCKSFVVKRFWNDSLLTLAKSDHYWNWL